ncbi:pitrilysin family protein [Atrimonas thermophila]
MFIMDYTKKILPSGMRVIFRKMESPLVALNLWAKVGTKDERPEKNGISHFFEHMVFKGTQSFPQNTLARKVQALGGSINAGTSLDTTNFYLVLPGEEWEAGIRILAELVTNPLFEAEDIEKEKLVVLQEINIDEDNPEERLIHLLYQEVFAETPYGMPILGKEETVKTFTREDLLEHKRRYYHPLNLSFVGVGNIEEDEFFYQVEKAFSETPFSEIPWTVQSSQWRFKLGKFYQEAKDVQRFYGAIGFPCASLKSEDFYALRFASVLLGEGLGSRLNISLREEKQLVDAIHTSYSYYERAGLFGIFYSFLKGDPLQVQEAIWKEIELLTNSLSKEELERARNLLKSSLYQVAETTLGSSELLGRLDVIDTADRVLHYFMYLEGMQAEKIQEVITKYFKPEQATHIVISPEGTI